MLVRHRGEGWPAERAAQTARRKAIYEELHPETRRGGDRKSDQVANLATRFFMDETAEHIAGGKRNITAADFAADPSFAPAIAKAIKWQTLPLDLLSMRPPNGRRRRRGARRSIWNCIQRRRGALRALTLGGMQRTTCPLHRLPLRPPDAMSAPCAATFRAAKRSASGRLPCCAASFRCHLRNQTLARVVLCIGQGFKAGKTGRISTLSTFVCGAGCGANQNHAHQNAEKTH